MFVIRIDFGINVGYLEIIDQETKLGAIAVAFGNGTDSKRSTTTTTVISATRKEKYVGNSQMVTIFMFFLYNYIVFLNLFCIVWRPYY
ncbi:hypothetical protein PHAVU_002G183700, partial [Phaseolus vulgaris]|uniref:Uncharacterized protein n=1 Tax=Phaseolus vulgaris TaxID=3885 RepID=V7CN67_PHAVU|nr:hypothetical protein PHAVU_002G183700g [Phaseolus vulgaris]ESW30803.1 hypothetical protein PHAVU_002G183700g [Phaseolus vulgaris]